MLPDSDKVGKVSPISGAGAGVSAVGSSSEAGVVSAAGDVSAGAGTGAALTTGITGA